MKAKLASDGSLAAKRGVLEESWPASFGKARVPCVLILGAGASAPYGLPIGIALRDYILKLNPYSYSRYLDELGVREHQFREFLVQFSRSGFLSIDAFLEERSRWMKIGKFAIAFALINHEHTRKLFPPYAPKDHWFNALWLKLKKKTWNEVKRTTLRIVTFNYDRCLEYYLASVIANNYGVSFTEVFRWLSQVLVIHVHGTLGNYTLINYYWKDPKKEESVIDGLKSAIDAIVVVSEANPKTLQFVRARAVIARARSVAFIGFGFGESNMARLGFAPDHQFLHPDISLSCTLKGLTPSARARIKRRYFGTRTLHSSHKSASISQLIEDFVQVY